MPDSDVSGSVVLDADDVESDDIPLSSGSLFEQPDAITQKQTAVMIATYFFIFIENLTFAIYNSIIDRFFVIGVKPI